VDRIARNFVPIAVNLYEIRDAKNEAGDFFRAARLQKNQYQGLWVIAPDGKVLAGHHEHSEEVKKWTAEVLATIDTALEKAGPLTARKFEPRDVLPHWGKTVQKDGSVTLALWTRYFFQGKGIGKGAVDAVTFSAKQWQEFAPPEPASGDPVKGKTWHIAGKVASEFSRCLSTVSDKATMPTPDEVTEVDFTGSVERVKNGIASISYAGRISTLHTNPFNKKYVNTAHAKLRGIGTYDIAKREMVSLLWILEGSTRDVRATDQDPLAAVVEWRRDPPGERWPRAPI
jgi:hypothetical protein